MRPPAKSEEAKAWGMLLPPPHPARLLGHKMVGGYNLSGRGGCGNEPGELAASSKDSSPFAVLLAPPGGAGRHCSEPAPGRCLLLPGPEHLQSLHHHKSESSACGTRGPGYLRGKDERCRIENHEWPEDSMSPGLGGDHKLASATHKATGHPCNAEGPLKPAQPSPSPPPGWGLMGHQVSRHSECMWGSSGLPERAHAVPPTPGSHLSAGLRGGVATPAARACPLLSTLGLSG